jgi:hypothetical protein
MNCLNVSLLSSSPALSSLPSLFGISPVRRINVSMAKLDSTLTNLTYLTPWDACPV